MKTSTLPRGRPSMVQQSIHVRHIQCSPVLLLPRHVAAMAVAVTTDIVPRAVVAGELTVDAAQTFCELPVRSPCDLDPVSVHASCMSVWLDAASRRTCWPGHVSSARRGFRNLDGARTRPAATRDAPAPGSAAASCRPRRAPPRPSPPFLPHSSYAHMTATSSSASGEAPSS